jgi:hypothetical protein
LWPTLAAFALLALAALASAGPAELGYALGLGVAALTGFIAWTLAEDRFMRQPRPRQLLKAELVRARWDEAIETDLERIAQLIKDVRAETAHAVLRTRAQTRADELERAIEPPAVVIRPDQDWRW